MAKWIKADGTLLEVHPKNKGQEFTLDELKSYVGGWIECIFLNQRQVMVINEEGKLRGLPYNTMATEAYRLVFQPTDEFIVGDALLCDVGTEIS